MPKQFDDEKRGVLFKNDRKGNEKAPDYKGNCTLQGVEYKMAVWLRRSAKDQPYFSVAFTPTEEQAQFDRQVQSVSPRVQQQQPEMFGGDDDLPF